MVLAWLDLLVSSHIESHGQVSGRKYYAANAEKCIAVVLRLLNDVKISPW